MQCLKYVKVLRNLKTVVHDYFGTKLRTGFVGSIHIFRRSYIELGILITLKVHIIIFHELKFLSTNSKRFEV